MIIDFQPFIDRRRAAQSHTRQAQPATSTRAEVSTGLSNHPWTPFDDAPPAYQVSFQELWPRVHAAIDPKDLYANETERRLGMISHLAMYLVDAWPANLKTFLYRKYGEGCVDQAALTSLLRLIDQTASLARLRPIEQIHSELMKPAR